MPTTSTGGNIPQISILNRPSNSNSSSTTSNQTSNSNQIQNQSFNSFTPSQIKTMSNQSNNQGSAGNSAAFGGGSQPSPSFLQRGSAFPFAGQNPSSAASRNQNQNNPTSGSGQPLDLNDFPALGGQGGGPFSSSAAAVSGGGAGQNQNQNQNLTASNLLSSYASQAGVTGLSGSTGSSAIGGGMGGPGLSRQPPGSFSTDDFPALGAPNGQQNLPNRNPSNQTQSNSTPGSNQVQNQQSGGGAAAVVGSTGHLQEQASAAAALQHQHLAREAHRQSLLGSMSSHLSNNGSNGSQQNQLNNSSSNQPSPNNNGTTTGPSTQQQPQMNAARAGFGEPERNYTSKLGLANSQPQSWIPPSAAFPSSSSSTSSSAQINGSSRSPHPSSASVPGGNNINSSSSPRMDHSSSNSIGMSSSQLLYPGTGAGVPEIQTPAQQVLTSPADRFGLLGLLTIIKMQDPDLSMLAMGADLQTMGLNLNATDSLYSTFLTPWSDSNSAAAMNLEPDFHLPSCYNVHPPPPAQSKINSFADETLFFIFYATPRDALQEVAAQELYNRNWRYHKELHLWLTKEQNTEPTQKTQIYERGNYVFFDPSSWEKVTKNFVLMYELLEEKPPSHAHMAAAQVQQHQQQHVYA